MNRSLSNSACSVGMGPVKLPTGNANPTRTPSCTPRVTRNGSAGGVRVAGNPHSVGYAAQRKVSGSAAPAGAALESTATSAAAIAPLRRRGSDAAPRSPIERYTRSMTTAIPCPPPMHALPTA